MSTSRSIQIRKASYSVLVLMLLILATLAAAAPPPITPPANRTPAISLGPVVVDPGEAGIGGQIPDIRLQSTEGQDKRLYSLNGERGMVIIVRDPECPVSRRYGPRISSLARQFGSVGFGFVFIYPNAELQPQQRTGDAQTLGVPGFYAQRGSFALAEALGVKSTGDVFVLDTQRRLRYRGAVDDQYGLGYTKDIPTRNYLRNALDALQQGREIATPATAAPGCYIDADPAMDRLFPALPGGQMLS